MIAPSTRLRSLALLSIIGAMLSSVLWVKVGGRAHWIEEVENAGHGVAFCVIAVAWMLLRVSAPNLRLAVWQQYAAAFFLTALLGAATELLQIPLARDASWLDLGNDGLGAFVGLALFSMLDARLTLNKRIALPVSALLPFALLAAPVVLCIAAYFQRDAAFPVIADFTRAADDYFVEPRGATIKHTALPQPWASDDERAMYVRFEDGAYPGLDFFEPVPNWERYRALALDVTNTGAEPLTLQLRVNDAAHNDRYDDRFNTILLLASMQRSVIRLPLAEIRNGPQHRTLNMERISDLMIFVAKDDAHDRRAPELFLSRIWLE